MKIASETWMFPQALSRLLFVLGLGLIPALASAADMDSVRVRLGSSPKVIEVFADQIQFEIHNEKQKWDRQKGSSPLKFVVVKKAAELELQVFQPRKPMKSWTLESLPLRIQIVNGQFGPKKIPPQLILDQVQGVIELRAEVEFSDYLLGVLSREMPGSWPLEALKAQTIATRSYTLSQMKARTHWSFDLEGSILDQEFEWVTPEKRATRPLLRWAEALEATRNQVLRGTNGEVFRAFYHSDCGGRTTTPDFVWGPTGDYKSVRDPSCEVRPTNKWKFVAEKKWLRSQLQHPTGMKESQAGLEFSWIQSLFDQRVTLVEWWDGLADLRILSGQNFRQLLGFGKLKSLRFQSREQGQDVIFEGRGFGHGVGLCQWGSKDWAEKGMSTAGILSHYYPLARLGAHDPRKVAVRRGAGDLTER